MSQSLKDLTERLMEHVREGEFVEGMEALYADDAVNQEPSGDAIVGKDAIIANEHKILEGVAAYHGADIRHIGVASDDGNGNGITFAEYSFKVDMKDGSTFNPEQVQVTRWENGKAKHIRFYYDPSQL